MSGPQRAQTKATLGASPSNFLESPCRKARSRLRAVLRPVTMGFGQSTRRCSVCEARRGKGRGYAKRWVMRSREAPHRPTAMNIKPMASQRDVRNFAQSRPAGHPTSTYLRPESLAGDRGHSPSRALARPRKHQTTEDYLRVDVTQRIGALTAVTPPRLRPGRFRPSDALIASLQS